jgi:hypothetical protein
MKLKHSPPKSKGIDVSTVDRDSIARNLSQLQRVYLDFPLHSQIFSNTSGRDGDEYAAFLEVVSKAGFQGSSYPG